MANIFLDANRLIDFVEKKDDMAVEGLKNHELLISVLSWHIIAYVCKWRIPSEILKQLVKRCTSVAMDDEIVIKSLEGPTDDFEDNVQLHSAIESDGDYFLTLDKKLLKMKFFGKVVICDKM